MKLRGIHHITGFARDGDESIRFYCDVLGQRLVKVTVNYDDPSSYHIYFGDHRASPGTLLTFFIWPDAPRQGSENGQIERIAYAVPNGAIDFWQERLASFEVEYERAQGALRLRDPDGLAIDLTEGDTERAHGSGPSGFCSATFAEADPNATAQQFQDVFGMTQLSATDDGYRMRLGDGGEILLVHRDDASRRTRAVGPGVLHHIAFRAADDDEQLAWMKRVSEKGMRPTSVRDRTYFRSIYFREPGGVLFEIATDSPGMTADEPLEALGEKLTLPSWLETERKRIESHLPKLQRLR